MSWIENCEGLECTVGFNDSNVYMRNTNKDRFTPSQIRQLLTWFRTSDIEYRGRVRPSPEIAVCIVCTRLSYPNRLRFDLESVFGISYGWISTVYTDTLLHMTKQAADTDILHSPPNLTYQDLQRWISG